MTLSDFHLYSLRATERARKRKEDHELLIELQRTWNTIYVNRTRGKGESAVKPTDFYLLSYDSQVKDNKPINTENLLRDMANRFTPRHKRKKDG